MQWMIGDGAPRVFHATSVLLYVGVCLALFGVCRRILPFVGAWVATAFFAVHPVHVEAVANIVSQAELLAALWSIIALGIYLRARVHGRAPRPLELAAIVVLYAAAFLSKEHGVMLPAVFLAAEATVVRDRRSLRERARVLFPVGAALVVVAVALVAIRSMVLGSFIGEQMLVEVPPLARIWTMLGIVPEWVRLFLWPARLSADYSPNAVPVLTEPSLAVIPGVLVLLAGAAILIAAFRHARPAAFGLSWALIALAPVSNLFSVLVIAERTLFVPTAGVCVALGWGFARVLDWARPSTARANPSWMPASLWGVAVVLLALGTWRSARRQLVWKDNATLFAQMVNDAPMAYRAHYLYGISLFEQGRPAEGERELRTAIALNDVDSDPRNYLATQYRMAKLYAQAIPLYREALRLRPTRPDSRYGLAHALLETGDLAGARAQVDSGLAGGQMKGYFEALRELIEQRTQAPHP
jgi:hypothetical protein